MAMIEAITVLAVIEAQDRATGILGDMFGSIGRVADAFKAAGAASEESARLMDAGLLEGATAAERLTNAEAKLATAQKATTESSTALRDAQEGLVASLDAEGKATDTTAAAQARLRRAQLDNTIATGNLRDANLGLGVAQRQVKANTEATMAGLGTTANGMMMVGAATALTAGYSVKLAGDFQQQTQVLVSGANVSQSALDGVRKNILATAVDTGTSTKDLTNSFFALNSRLGDVTKSEQAMADAAELAKAHNADLNTVSIALASSMNAYAQQGLTAGQASAILGVAVEKGGMSFQELSSSLSTVLPKAQEAHQSFAMMTAAIATMTASGQSASQATVDLAHTISKVQSPTAQMLSTWNQLGLTQKQVADTLHGPGGLEAAMNLIADTAKSKLGPSGQVIISTMRQSQDATASLTAMMKSMQPQAASLAHELVSGSISYKDYTAASKNLTGAGYDQAHQFELLYGKANAFNDAIKAGKPGFSGFSDLLKASYGDATSMQTALLLGGQATQKWTDITKEATKAGADNAKGIAGWDGVQKTLNQQISQAKEGLKVMAINLGTALLPAVLAVVKEISPWISGLAKLIEHHQNIAKYIIAAAIALGLLGVALKITLGLYNLFKDTALMIKGIKEAMAAWELATKAQAAASEIMAAAQWLLNAALDAFPVILIIAAIVALVVGIIYMYNHFKWFHDFVNMVWDGLKTGAMAVWHALEAAFSGIMAAVSAVAGFITGAFKAVTNFLSSTWNAITGGIMTAWNGISAWFKKWWPLLLVIFAFPIAVLVGIWNHFHTEIISAMVTAWNYISGFFVGLWGYIVTAAKFVWGLIKTTIIQPMQELWKLLEEGWSYVSKALSAAWGYISGAASFVWKEIKKYIVTPMDEVVSYLGGIASKIWNVISGAFNSVFKFINGLNNQFLSIGTNFVMGIVNGIKNAAGWLMKEVGDLANDALGAAKSMLGISSPSKRAADEIGKWVPHGVAVGVAAHTQVAVDAVKKMANALPGAVGAQGALNLGVAGVNQAGVAMGAGLGLSSAGGSAANGITLNLDLRGAVVAGDKGMQDLTNQIGSVIATKMLPQAGVRFH